MQTRDFCFWLQGLLEVGKIETLDADQVELIKAHLDLVFKHDVNIKTKEMEHPAPPIQFPSVQDRFRDQLSGIHAGTPYRPDAGMIATC